MIAVVGALGGVIFSPLVIGRLSPADDAQWQRLSDVGQTYGAASAVLSVLALIGVVVSLMIQARETRVAREQARRALHFELLKMAMDDPFYLRVWGPFAPPDTDRYREHMYANLIVSHWQMDWEVGTLDEEHLREVAAIFLQGEIGNRFWHDVREMRMKAEGSQRRRRRFLQIIDQEYRQAVIVPFDESGSVGASGVDAPSEPTRADRSTRWKVIGTLALGAVVGTEVGAWMLRRRRRVQ
jgi:hypothetical protein